MMNNAEAELARFTRDRRPVLLVSKGDAAERLARSYLRPCDIYLQSSGCTGQDVSDAIDMCANTTLVVNLNLLSDDVALNRIKVLMDGNIRPCGMVIAHINMDHTNLKIPPKQKRTLKDLHLETIFNHSIIVVVS